MTSSSKTKTISTLHRRWRHMGAWICRHVFVPAGAVNRDASMAATGRLLEQGHGVLIVINHFSRRDPVQVLALLMGDRVVSDRPFLAPVAFHQQSRLVQTLADSFVLQLAPVVTGHTRRRMKEKAPQESGLERYLASAVESLRTGGVVLLAPQGRRRALLGAPPFGRPMELLLGAALDAGLERVALLFMGLSIPGTTTYDRRVVGGLNLFRQYEARYGMPVTLRQALEEAGGREGLDRWTFDRLAGLVPPAYVRPGKTAGPPHGSGSETPGQLGLGEDVDD